MKKFIIQNAIVNINNEKINILILENKEKLEKYILYLVNNINEEINLTNKFEKFEFKDNISITPKKKFVDSKIEIFYNSSTKKHSLLLNKKQIYFTLNPHITLYNENIIINDNFKLIKADSTLYNPSENLYISNKSYENDLISKILNDNKNKIDENIEIKNLINNTLEHSIVNEVFCKITQPHLSQVDSYSEFVNILEDRRDESIQFHNEAVEFLEEIIESEELVENIVENEEEVFMENTIEIKKKEEEEIFMENTIENEEEVSMENTIKIEKKEEKEIFVENTIENEEEVSMENTIEIEKEKEIFVENTVEIIKKEEKEVSMKNNIENKEEDKKLIENIIEIKKEVVLVEDSDIKIINLNSKIIPSNDETFLPDCKEIKIIEKKFEEDKEIKNIEILKMDNVENKLKNIFDLDKIMTDFNNLFNDLSNEEKELPKNQNISSKKVHFSDQNIMEVNKDITNINIPQSHNTSNEIKKDNDLVYNKLVNYQNINYKIPTIRILPTQNLNFSNLYTSQIHENNILLNLNLSIELGKDNLSYLIKIGNQKYLINKTINSIVLTNLFNKNSQIIKNKDNFKIGILDYILYNDCTLLMQVTNKTYFDNNYGRTISVYTPKF